VKRLNMLLVAALLIISLGTSTGQVKAYGNTTSYTINCPTMRFTGRTDHPFRNAAGQRYVMGFLTNETTGFNMTFSPSVVRTEPIVTPVGSTYISYIFDQTYILSPIIGKGGKPVDRINIGDVIRIYLFDYYTGSEDYAIPPVSVGGTLLNIRFTCGSETLSGTTIPSGFTLMTIMCPANILSGPAGAVLSPVMPDVGKQRYVLPVGAMGSDGQLYDKIQANAVTFGYFPRRCLA
jgi:hypothetical protein